MRTLEKKFGMTFKNEALIKQAFTHSSYVNEHQSERLSDNERLEFLGDAVLELAVSDYLFKKYPDMAEGEMTKLRALIVCEEALHKYARILKLSQYILLGKGEERAGGRTRRALLADVFEAFLGALYLDQGMDLCQKFLKDNIFPYIEDDAFSDVMDYKTQLQEIIQQDKTNYLSYRIVNQKGPSHQREFFAEVSVNDDIKKRGQGKSKKIAEQQAAKAMIEYLLDTKILDKNK